MYEGRTVFSQLMDFLPRHTFRRRVERYDGDDDFYRAFRDIITSIEEAPRRYATVRGEVGRVVFRRFPYLLFCVVEGDEVVLLACVHERRSPDHWPEG